MIVRYSSHLKHNQCLTLCPGQKSTYCKKKKKRALAFKIQPWICTFVSLVFEWGLFSQGCVLNSKVVSSVWSIFTYNIRLFLSALRLKWCGTEIEMMLSLLILILESCWIVLLFVSEWMKGPLGPSSQSLLLCLKCSYSIMVLFSQKMSLLPRLSHGQQLIIQSASLTKMVVFNFWQVLEFSTLVCDLLKKGVS